MRDDGKGKLVEYLSGKPGQQDTTTIVTAPSGEYRRVSLFGGRPSYTVTYSEDVFPTTLKKKDMIQTLDNVHRRAIDGKGQGGIVKGQLGISGLPVNPNIVKYVYDKIENALTPANR